MLALIAPLNTVYATIDKKFYDTIDFDSGLKLFRDTGFHPEEHAMLQATVVSVPKAIMNRQDYEGMTIEVQPGDRILMRYDVVFSYTHQPERDTPIYKNVLLYQGIEYWKVDLQKIFGIIQEDTIIMVNGYVCCDLLEEEQEDSGLILRPDNFRKKERRDKMVVRYIGRPLAGQPALNCDPGDIIYCSPGVAQLYEINQKNFYIIKQSHIVGMDDNMVKK